MKHMHLVHAQVVAMGGFGIAQEGIAQEGFVDAIKDFLSFKATPENVKALHTSGRMARELAGGMEKFRLIRPNAPADAMRFLWRDDKLSLTLVRDILGDVKTVSNVNAALRSIVQILKESKIHDEGDAPKKKLDLVIKQAVRTLDDVQMLGNFYFSFDAIGADGITDDYIDDKLSPTMGKSSGIGSFVANAVFHYLDKKAAEENLARMNSVLEDTDVKQFKSALLAMAKELETAGLLAEEFLAEYERNKKHSNKHIRFTLRYGHSVVGMVSMIANVYRAFTQYER